MKPMAPQPSPMLSPMLFDRNRGRCSVVDTTAGLASWCRACSRLLSRVESCAFLLRLSFVRAKCSARRRWRVPHRPRLLAQHPSRFALPRQQCGPSRLRCAPPRWRSAPPHRSRAAALAPVGWFRAPRDDGHGPHALLGEAPELFRLIPGSLRRHTVFGKPTNLAFLTPVGHETPYDQRTGSCAREMSSTGHDIRAWDQAGLGGHDRDAYHLSWTAAALSCAVRHSGRSHLGVGSPERRHLSCHSLETERKGRGRDPDK